MKVKGIGIVAITMVVAACTTLDPYTREEQTARAQRNALIGAASGKIQRDSAG